MHLSSILCIRRIINVLMVMTVMTMMMMMKMTRSASVHVRAGM